MASVGKAAGVSEERVRARAYEIWLQEGRPQGREIGHWQQAEAELAVDRPRASRRKQLAAE
jgi:hypothetical protein